MKPITNFLLFLSILVFAGQAFAFDLKVPDKFTLHDSSMYVRQFSQHNVEYVGTGGCYGPVYQLSKNGNWMADFISVCGLAAANLQNESTNTQFSGDLGFQIVNFWGLQAGVFYNPSDRHFTWGIGFSPIGLAGQLMK